MLNKMMNFLRDEEGASAVEYGLIVGLIAVAIIAILLTTGTNLSALFKKVSDQLSTVVGGAAA
ncbi:Flp family type IVb pilin [Solimonas flava]|uniref:Flp family type IVb pilin n=1 Tax=Solimonas flava TaxID=415849 RepID=UPI000400013D|nr:Flp family type IVb pilin [Solimonas flava]